MKKTNQLNILILSARPLHYSGNLGGDLRKALQKGGHNVDYYICPTYANSEIEIYGETKNIFSKKIKSFFKSNKILKAIYQNIKNIYFKILPSKIKNCACNGFQIHYPYEEHPGFPSEKIVNSISKDYDLIITLYWYHFINTTSLKTIYDLIQCPIIILPIDMGPMTGGCYYFKNCRNFTNECRNCPAEGILPYGQCHKNYLHKKKNYDSINCAWVANSWMNQLAKQSRLFENNVIEFGGFILDETKYAPNHTIENRESLGIGSENVVLLTRSSREIRKGALYIINGILDLYESLSLCEREKLLILTVGDDYIYHSLTVHGINVKNFGYVNNSKLIKLYQIANFFLSASIDDAGPSMVNHSISCGTPVVCFNNGCAVDVIENGVSGFKTDIISKEAYSEILTKAYYHMQNNNYEDLRKSTREKSLKYSSFKSAEENIMRIYYKLIQKNKNTM